MEDKRLSEDQESGFSISMSAPDLTDAEREAVLEVLRTPRLSMGPQIEAFETAVAQFVGARYAVAVSSGTGGLHLCVRAAGITDGDWVITTPFSFIASANVILYERAIPIFVDVDSRTGNIDPEQVAQAAQDLLRGGSSAARWLPRKRPQSEGRLKAILPVDVFGQPADYDALNAVANENDLVVIEDSCEALGARYKDRPAGMLGDAGVFAFYPNKQITTGEGGVIVTQNKVWADAFRSLRNQGRAPENTWLEHTHMGYNYRMDEMSAALGRVQMTRIAQLLEKRSRVAEWYAERLAAVPGVEAPNLGPDATRASWFVYVVRLAAGVDRGALVERLAAEGIPSRPYFVPIHTQPYFVERFEYRSGDFPVTEDLGERSLALPFSSVMTEEEVDRVCRALAGNLE
jgi:perosamine synthetase